MLFMQLAVKLHAAGREARSILLNKSEGKMGLEGSRELLHPQWQQAHC